MPELSNGRERYALARAQGLTQEQAAASAGVSARTGWAYDHEPAVVARVDEIQADVSARVLRRFRARADRAAERVTELIEPGRVSTTGELNLKAALATLKFVLPDAEKAAGGTTVNVGVALSVGLTPDERAERLRALVARTLAD
jgi:hypothetical protein